jgi:hypothetical protein
MLEQVSTPVKFLAFYTASKQGKTGLTVAVDIYDPSGTQIVTAGSATALGGGLYSYVLSTNKILIGNASNLLTSASKRLRSRPTHATKSGKDFLSMRISSLPCNA